jgi:DNA repair exonuclease SbcCD nuclease subunit
MGYDFKFIHCADLHLGSRFKGLGLENSELAKRMRASVQESFSRIVDAAISKGADAMVISGDLYDDNNELPSTRMWLSRELARAGIPVFICRGNHDSRTSWDASIPYPDNVHEFGQSVERMKVGDNVEVVGISYSTPHEERNLASMIGGSPGLFTIACVHSDVDSVSEGYPYAPCSMSDLVGRSVDYWALGHIHKRTVVSSNPYVVYPGNIQGRSFKETGQKGAYLVTVSSGRVSAMEFIPTQSYIWENISVDISDKDLNMVREELSRRIHKGSVCRITFTGAGDLNTVLRTDPDDVGKALSSGLDIIISEMIVRTSPAIDMEARSKGKDMGAAIIQCGRRMESLSASEIVDILCQNRLMAQNRDILSGMSEDELRNLVSDATKDCLVRMEAGR